MNTLSLQRNGPMIKSPKTSKNTKVKSSRRATPKTKSEKSEHYDEVRLNKFIASCGEASRRAADDLIKNGAVSVNDKPVMELGYKINKKNDIVKVNGKALRESKQNVYILLNKPKDTVTTSSDEKNRRSVLDLIAINERVFPVGRLDRNTTGVLLLTNDGELTYRLTHPSYEIAKEYVATLDEKVTTDVIKKFQSGFNLKDTGERLSPCKAKILDDGFHVWLSIHEGKNRQIHRMFWSFGISVKKLNRIAYCGLNANKLKLGEWRFLTSKEVKSLYKSVSLKLNFTH